MNSSDTEKHLMVFSLKWNQSRGFMIIELLIVFGILAVLSAIAVFSYTQLIEKARYITVVEDIRNIVSLLDIYYLENNEYPNNFDKVGVGALRDPWGTPYQYVNLKTDYGERRKDNSENPINSFYDLWSNGKDGKTHKQVSKKEGRDDIIRARDGEFIGYGREFD